MILFIHPQFSSFVESDFIILKNNFSVKSFHYQTGKAFLTHLSSHFRMVLWLICNISRAKVLYVWFADYHSFLPALFSLVFRKKFILVLGGYDVMGMPEISYGSLINPLRKYCTLFSIRHATLNLAVSHFVKQKAMALLPEANIMVLYNGVNTDLFKASRDDKSDMILTVGMGNTSQRIKLKGIDYFCQIARSLPEFQFMVIGFDRKTVEDIGELPANLIWLEKVFYQDLPEYYQKAKVYCQFSMVESFGMALAESMLCECVPVVFGSGAMPEIVGDTGFIVEKNRDQVIKTIRNAMRKLSVGRLARQRILNNFSMHIREAQLIKLIKTEIASGR